MTKNTTHPYNKNFTTIQFFAGMTLNGNSRRVYVTLENGVMIATYKDNGAGSESIKNLSHKAAYQGQIFETNIKEYNYLCKYFDGK